MKRQQENTPSPAGLQHNTGPKAHGYEEGRQEHGKAREDHHTTQLVATTSIVSGIENLNMPQRSPESNEGIHGNRNPKM